MKTPKRDELLEEYLDGPNRIREFLKKAPKGALHFRPFDDAWTMAEHLEHLFDAEVHGYLRYRFAIAEPGTKIPLWSQEGWKAKLDYGKQDPNATLELLARLRAAIHHHLSSIASEDWSGYTFVHPERGAIDLDGWLEIYTGHVRTHLEYLERNQRLFAKE